MAESNILMKTHYWSYPFVQVNFFFKRNWQGWGAFLKDDSVLKRQTVQVHLLMPLSGHLGP